MTRWLCPVIHWTFCFLKLKVLTCQWRAWWLWTPCLSHGMAHFLATKSGWKNAASRQQSAALSWINWRKYIIPSCELQLLSQRQWSKRQVNTRYAITSFILGSCSISSAQAMAWTCFRSMFLVLNKGSRNLPSPQHQPTNCKWMVIQLDRLR